MIVDCALDHTFLWKDGQHFIRTRSDGCTDYLARIRKGRRLRRFLHPFPHLCELNPCLTGLMIVEGSHFSHQSGRSRRNPSPAGSARASPNDQVVICTMLGVQVSSKAKHWSTTFRAQKIVLESLPLSRLLVFLKSNIFADS